MSTTADISRVPMEKRTVQDKRSVLNLLAASPRQLSAPMKYVEIPRKASQPRAPRGPSLHAKPSLTARPPASTSPSLLLADRLAWPELPLFSLACSHPWMRSFIHIAPPATCVCFRFSSSTPFWLFFSLLYAKIASSSIIDRLRPGLI